MNYNLSSIESINYAVKNAPETFIDACDRAYNAKIDRAADMIAKNLSRSPIVLLSGPSGSGKTTTAHRIDDELESRGIVTYTVSMDDYFITVNPKTCPRTPDGDIDYESPEMLDMELLNEHFAALAQGEEIRIPYFMFARQKRSASKFTKLHLKENEVVIFEGIHALNDAITVKNPDAFKLYISAASQIQSKNGTVFKPEWTRLCRRMVRDDLFRGADAVETADMWENVLRGEQLYISPFVNKADLIFDTFLPYELPVMRRRALALLRTVKQSHEMHTELSMAAAALEEFEEMDDAFVRPESLLREFIGGGIYEY